jgi:O-antigen/teichoic acid export membrane protein
MKVQKKALENTFFITLSWIITTLGGFLFWLIAGKFLTQEEYGIAITSISFGFFVISIITFGFPAAISKLVPEYKAKRNYKRIRSIITLSTIVILFSNIFLIILMLSFSNLFLNYLKFDRTIFYLVILYIFIGSFSTTFYTIIYSFQEMKEYLFIGSSSLLIKILASILILLLGFKYFGPIVGTITSSLFTLILCFPKIHFTRKYSLYDEELFKYAITGFVGALAFSLLVNSQYTIITIMKTVGNTGIFGVAMMISSIVGAIPNILNSSIYPIISEIFGKKAKKSIPILIENIVRYALFLSIPIIIVFSLLSNLLVLSFSSYKFLGATKLIPILSISSLFLGLSTIFMNTLFAMRRPKLYIKILLIISFVYITIISVLTYFLSEFGTSIGYMITTIIFFLISFHYSKEIIKLKIKFDYLIKILTASLSFLPLYFFKPINIFSAMALSGLCFISYILFLLFLKFFTKHDFEILKYFLREKLNFSQK